MQTVSLWRDSSVGKYMSLDSWCGFKHRPKSKTVSILWEKFPLCFANSILTLLNGQQFASWLEKQKKKYCSKLRAHFALPRLGMPMCSSVSIPMDNDFPFLQNCSMLVLTLHQLILHPATSDIAVIQKQFKWLWDKSLKYFDVYQGPGRSPGIMQKSRDNCFRAL